MAQDDFLDEVKKDVRREQLMQIWQSYGNIIIGCGLALIIAIAGYIGFEKYQYHQLNKQSRQFEQLLLNPSDAKLREEVARSGTPGFKILTVLREALSQADNELLPSEIVKKIIQDKSLEAYYRDYAAFISIASKFNATSAQVLISELNEIILSKSTFSGMAKELLAFAFLKGGAKNEARNLFLELYSDASAPRGVRQRAQAMISYLER